MEKKISKRIIKTDDEWREILNDEQYDVCRNQGTERPFSGEYTQCNEQGVYCCICCGEPLIWIRIKI